MIFTSDGVGSVVMEMELLKLKLSSYRTRVRVKFEFPGNRLQHRPGVGCFLKLLFPRLSCRAVVLEISPSVGLSDLELG